MQNNTISFCYTAKPISYEKINDNFTKMRCYVMAIGKNRNFSHIGMDAVEQALPSLYNIPVVGHLKKAEDGSYYIGGHDRQIVIDENGVVLNDLTVPFGIVPETNNFKFVEITEEDGDIAIYLVCDILLWTGRYGEIMDATYSEDIYFGQSMEINPTNVEPLKEDKNYQDIKSFEFSALCLLGKSDNPDYHTEPCFPSARVEPFNYNTNKENFKNEFSLMMSQLKELAFSIEDNSSKKKEVKDLDEKMKLLQEYNLTLESLDFSIEDMSVEDLKVKLDEFEAKKIEDKEKDFALAEQFKEELIEKLSVETIVSEWDSSYQYPRYSFIDYDDEKSIVYCYDRMDWKLYGFTFAKNGDSVDVDFETKTRKKIAFEDFNEGVSADFSIEGAVSDIFESITTKSKTDLETLQSDFDAYKSEYKTAETEVEELREFKSTKLSEERDNAETEIFSNFEEKLANVEEFKALKENCTELSLEDIEKECYAILGRQNFTFSKQTKKESKTPKLPIHTPTHDELLYGGIFAQYGKSGK